VASTFELEPLGAVRVKGRTEPIEACSLGRRSPAAAPTRRASEPVEAG